jgi:hypothetical protein
LFSREVDMTPWTQPFKPIPMIQPLKPVGGPAPVGLPPAPAGGPGGGLPPGPGGGLGAVTDPFGYMKQKVQQAASSPAVASAVTSAFPPLSFYTHHLGDAKPMADQVLGAVQEQVRDPARYGMMAAGLAPGLTKGILSTGPAAFPLLLAGHGLLAGGNTLTDLRTLMGGLGQPKPGG